MHVCVCVRPHACMRVCVHVCVCVCMRACDTHTHTQSQTLHILLKLLLVQKNQCVSQRKKNFYQPYISAAELVFPKFNQTPRKASICCLVSPTLNKSDLRERVKKIPIYSSVDDQGKAEDHVMCV